MSPGERSYDAIGLMKHLSEHSATAYADALEVLGNDTPETILKKRQLNKSIQGKENQHQPHDQLGMPGSTCTVYNIQTLNEIGTDKLHHSAHQKKYTIE